LKPSSGTVNTLYSAFSPNEGTCYAVGNAGTLLKTTNGGNNWTILSSLTTNALCSVFFTDSNAGYIVGTAGTITKTTDGGVKWIILQGGITNNNINSIFSFDANNFNLVGDYITILNTTNSGKNWQTYSSETNSKLLSVFFLDKINGFASGSESFNAFILKTTNGGISWSKNIFYDIVWLSSIQFTSRNVGYIAGKSFHTNPPYAGYLGNCIIKTTNSGLNWFTIYDEWYYEGLKTLHFYNDTIGYAVGLNGKILKTTNAGTNWTYIGAGVSFNLGSVYSTSADITYVAGDGGNNQWWNKLGSPKHRGYKQFILYSIS
jgi:photosystem II stability/assembly factor-like uncharacterized protein